LVYIKTSFEPKRKGVGKVGGSREEKEPVRKVGGTPKKEIKVRMRPRAAIDGKMS